MFRVLTFTKITLISFTLIFVFIFYKIITQKKKKNKISISINSQKILLLSKNKNIILNVLNNFKLVTYEYLLQLLSNSLLIISLLLEFFFTKIFLFSNLF